MFSSNVYDFNRLVIYVSFVFFLVALGWLSNVFIFNDAFYYSVLGTQISAERIGKIIEFNNKFQWISYVVMSIFILVKWSILAGVIYIGLFLLNQDISYKNCFKIVQFAEFTMLFAATTKLIWFISVHKPETIQELKYFYPLAITQLLNPAWIPSYLLYPLQQINLFEAGYWFLIASGIQIFTKKTFWQSFKITALSYGVAMFVWVLFIVFIHLQFD